MLAKAYYESPLGYIEIVGSELGIQSVRLMAQVPKQIPVPKLPILQSCISQLSEYFKGQRKEFDLKFDWGKATAFNKSVWTELLKIPYGNTTSYSVIAEKLNNSKAVRAVGLANRNNPIAIIVPCHRVIAKNGQLQGYFYGLDIKMKLLRIENPASFAPQGSLF